ncbi:MAG TPA: DUF6126 family protein [Streptomyces sp.]|uniref:DUF6126 family protein n=1 Tax=Streptomyces sp. TaxID=1931 RepID=UPI002BC43A26|nr:DUF6126 family protein [Streptomyces sp.]HWU08169.1 DUF6126 family protein [Streptomyces sp.]
MSDPEYYDPLASRRPKSADTQERRMPRGLVIRLIAYLVAGHVVAAFLFLLFTVAGKG